MLAADSMNLQKVMNLHEQYCEGAQTHACAHAHSRTRIPAHKSGNIFLRLEHVYEVPLSDGGRPRRYLSVMEVDLETFLQDQRPEDDDEDPQ